MKACSILALFVVIALTAHSANGVLEAECLLKGTENDPGISGTIMLSQASPNADVVFSGEITGLTVPSANSVHGFHVHTFGDVSHADGKGAGGHWNPYNVSHGCIDKTPVRHAGDIANLTFTGGSYTFPIGGGEVTSDLISLEGEYSIVGRALILHQLPDICVQPTGAAGARLAQCVVAIKDVTDNDAVYATAQSDSASTMWAVATVSPMASNAGENITGNVWFRRTGGDVRVYSRLSALSWPSETPRAIHVHTYGRDSLEAVGGHYNPHSVDHALPLNATRHVGDMGNWMPAYQANELSWHKDLSLLNINVDDNIIGRSVVVHQGEDQGYAEQPSGAAGPKIASGTIGTSRGPGASVVAVLHADTGVDGNPMGTITITQTYGVGSDVEITGSVSGFPEGIHAIHIHEYGVPPNLDADSGVECALTGGHYAPHGVPHACWPNERSVGDIGNITVLADGTGTINLDRDLINLESIYSVVGRAIVVHADYDHCVPPSGAAGARLACGTIAIKSVNDIELNAASHDNVIETNLWRASANLVAADTTAHPNFEGKFYFETVQEGNNAGQVRLYSNVRGLTANTDYGIRVYEFGDISDGTNTLGHQWLSLPDFKVIGNGVGYIYDTYESNIKLRGVTGIIGHAIAIVNLDDDAILAYGVVNICGAGGDFTQCWPSTIQLAPTDNGTEKWGAASILLVVAMCIVVIGFCAASIFLIMKKRKKDNSAGFI